MVADTFKKRILVHSGKLFCKQIFLVAGKCADSFSPDQECLIRWYKIDFSCQSTTLFREIGSRPKRFNSARTNRIASIKESFQSCNSDLQNVVMAPT